MTALEILADLRRQGVRIAVQGQRLRMQAPPEVLAAVVTPALRTALVDQATAVLAALRAESSHNRLLDLLAEAVREEDERHAGWLRSLRARRSEADLARWLREVAPDLAARIRADEAAIDGAFLEGDETQIRALLERWAFRWRAARLGLEYAIGLRDSDGEAGNG